MMPFWLFRDFGRQWVFWLYQKGRRPYKHWLFCPSEAKCTEDPINIGSSAFPYYVGRYTAATPTARRVAAPLTVVYNAGQPADWTRP